MGDELFESYLGVDKYVLAQQVGNQIYVRRGSRSMFSNLVHEGTHVLNYTNGFGINGASRWSWEKRAYFYERQYQIATESKVDYSTIDDMLVYIFLIMIEEYIIHIIFGKIDKMKKGDKMEQLINDIMSFISTRDISIIVKDGKNCEYDRFVTIATEILGWLKEEHKRTLWKQEKRYVKQKPLNLNFNYPWCSQIKNLVEKNERFKQFFTIEGTSFDFSKTVTEDEKAKVRKYVYDNYKPFSIEG